MTSNLSFPDDTRVVATSEQLSSNMDGEAVILNLKSGSYYGLNSVGTYIWETIQEVKTVEEIKTAILSVFEVDAATCAHDLNKVLESLVKMELIEIYDEKAP